MAGLLSALGTIFVGFGILGWVGLLTAATPSGRGAVAWPSAIQETPIFLAIGFGFALIAAGAIVDRLDRLLKALASAQTTTPAAASPSRIAAFEATSEIPEREQHELAARGWRVGIDGNGRWRATSRAATVVFESEREKRDWIAVELAQRP
jgi:hypothetical protein